MLTSAGTLLRCQAIKIVSKSLLRKQKQIKRVGREMVVHTALQKVEREIAIMKKLDHPNIVHCYEVIDDAEHDKLYIGRRPARAPGWRCAGTLTLKLMAAVLEYVEGGQVMNYDAQAGRYCARDAADGKPLAEEVARRYFRDVVKGLSYREQQARRVRCAPR